MAEHAFDLLQTISQVAAAFAGFMAIIVTFRPTTDWGTGETVMLVHFLQLSLGVVLLSLLPITLSMHPVTRDYVWTVSNGAVGLYHLYVLAWVMRRNKYNSVLQEFGGIVTFILTVIGSGVILMNLAVALGFGQSLQLIACFVGLIWMLAMALVQFVALLLGSVKFS